MFKRKKDLQNPHSDAYILIAEDDPDQRRLFISFAQGEITKIVSNENTTETQKLKLEKISVMSASNIRSLTKAIQTHQNVLLAILDCNMPDIRDGVPHDQFIKTGHKITGQHQTTDIVIENLPNTPITMISSQNRFQRIVSLYYQKKHDLSINFISKKDPAIIKKNIAYYLRQHIK